MEVMWNKPYSLKEGTAIVVGLMLTGLVLQIAVGPLEWGIFTWPANIVVLAAFVAALLAIWMLRNHVYFCRFMATMQAAVPAIALAALLTIVMGLTRQVPEGKSPADSVGITKMLNFWPFILVYVWMTAIVGEVTIRQVARFSWRRVPSFVSHLGLFMVLTCGTLGSADMQRLKMYCEQGKPEWRGLDAWSGVHQLPVAIQLEQFTIDEYPPKLMMVDGRGIPQPVKKPENLVIEEGFRSGQLAGWDIRVIKRINDAMPAELSRMVGKMPGGMMANIRMDSLGMARNKGGFIKSSMPGSACALYVRATQGSVVKEGWVSCGSYMFPYQGLQLDDDHTVAMPNREPRRYASLVDIYTQDGQNVRTEIEVNKPYSIAGWKIYQLSYNEQMGKWSNVSVFELVTDPWLPAVYGGIFMLLAGAVGMFLTAGRKKREEVAE